jgi:hypothetical protein
MAIISTDLHKIKHIYSSDAFQLKNVEKIFILLRINKDETIKSK